MSAELLTIEAVKVDADLQAREALNADTVTAYAAHLIEGGDLPPIVVFREGAFGEIWIGDGFHRRAAYVQAGRLAIPADVRKGSRRDAFLYALGANEEHGLRRTNADRRRAVTLALSDPELGKLGNRAIGKICKVSHPFVGTVRAALSKPESSLDEIDLWEGERDPDAQVKRILDCADVAECEALLGAAGCVVRELLECSNHRQELRKIARAKLHADVAALFSLRVPGRREAALRRSQELALYEAGATGAEFDTLAKPAEWAKALQFKNLSKLDRMIGLIAQVLKVDSWGDVNNKPLLEALPDGCAFKGWITAQCEKKAAEWVKQREQHKPPPVAWPTPVFGAPEQAEQEAQLLEWVKAASYERLRELWVWSHRRWQGYAQHEYMPWHAEEVIAAARGVITQAGIEVHDCPDPFCDGFTSGALLFNTQNGDDHKGGFCWRCYEHHKANADKNEIAIEHVAELLYRGWVTLAELGIEAAPVVEAARVAEAPELETLPPAPVEAAPVVEAAPAYKVGWGDDAEPAKRLCGRLQRAVKEDLTSAFDELKAAFTAWQVGRVVPSPLVKWVPAFDELGAWLDGRGFANEVIRAVRALVPALKAEAAPVEAAPVDAAPVEAAPVEAAYHLGTIAEAWRADALIVQLKQAATVTTKNASEWKFADFERAVESWTGHRVICAEQIEWLPAFRMAERWVKSEVAAPALIDLVKAIMKRARLTAPAVSDTDQDPIAFKDRDLWELAPLARVAFKKLLAYTEKLRIQDFNAAHEAAQVWQAAGESVPQGMPIEVQAVIEALANPANTKEQVADLLHVAHFAGKVAIRWINNAEEDEPVKTTSPTGRAMKAIKDAELGAAAK